MPYNGKSPAQINIAAMFGGAAKGNLNQGQVAKLERMAGRKGIFANVAQKYLNKYQASQTQTAGVAGAATAPPAVQTAGATNMGERINTIESRLSTLESGSDSAGAMQPTSEVVPPADMGGEAMPADMGGGAMPVDMSAPDISAAPQMPAVEEPIIPQSEQLGSLMASPFMVRQRKKMGPLVFKDQTGDGKITRADVIKARVEGYKK